MTRTEVSLAFLLEKSQSADILTWSSPGVSIKLKISFNVPPTRTPILSPKREWSLVRVRDPLAVVNNEKHVVLKQH